ncbi:MAG: hypothetical protein HYU63_03690 [Armatimonadetes bacterium]|nr:hypothetical protein [Armatimonadota bacterium]
MNKDKKNILFLSNGYGEDTIAVSLIEELKKLSDLNFFALPLVGEGTAYQEFGINPLFSAKILPSGGLIPANHLSNPWKALTQGLWNLTIKQIKILKKYKKEFNLVISVGDAYPVILGGLFLKLPQIFVGTAKSDYFCAYSKIEKFIFKKYAKIVFSRDEITAESLKKEAVNALYLGNAMMDSLKITKINFNIKGKISIGILPGSRGKAYEDFPIILKTVERLKNYDIPLNFLMALPSSLDLNLIKQISQNCSWNLNNENSSLKLYLYKENQIIHLFQNYFGDVLEQAYLILGQAGTGNEQAAGLGKPIIAFDFKPEKLSWYRLRQKGLLGEAILVVKDDPQKISKELINIIENKNLYKKMSEIGKKRMGENGASQKIAQYILKFINNELDFPLKDAGLRNKFLNM